MVTQLACAYTIVDTGPLASGVLSSALAAVALDVNGFLYEEGLRLITDNTVGLTRTVTLGIDASTLALATPVLQTNRKGIASVTVGTKGADYVRPPIAIVNPGTSKNVTVKARLQARLGLVAIGIVNGGTSYSAGTIIQASGGHLAPGGVQASAPVTVDGMGVINGIGTIVAGGPYNTVPTLTAVDPTGAGSGAILTASLGVVRIDVIEHGLGYDATATVTITGYFQSLAPTNALKVSAVTGFFKQALEIGTKSPVTATTPVLS